jgi:6-phosphogluconate dehydrogenase
MAIASNTSTTEPGLDAIAASWLLGLTASALVESPDLHGFAGGVSDSSEGSGTLPAAIDEAVPARVLSTALFERFTPRGEGDSADQLLSAMRYQFGGRQELELEKDATRNGGA